MARFYCDDSTKMSEGGARQTVVAIGGWLATDAQWTTFAEQWSAALTDAGVTEFHAADFFGGYGQFKNWDLKGTRHLEFSRRFTGIAARNVAAGVGFAVNQAAWRMSVPGMPFVLDHTPHERFSEKMLCMRSCLENLYRYHRESWVAEPIAVIIEDDNKGVGEVIDYCVAIKQKEPPWCKQYVSFTAGPKSLLPLQAADLLAYEVGRFSAEQLDPTPGRNPRKSFLALQQFGGLAVSIANKASIRKAAIEFRSLGLDVRDV